ncbi:ankyrin repeat domain-containing protein [Rugosimonospora africana]|uniref:Ankyrin repeat-containing protein n=1 Tax=Rugosimonospora africana TaxID=556532 RepID=A0A8J3R0T6_9ACTN|nr:hypothetical protein [Rugosimonospora africana]GIH19493.1 hypothetical protein Raf01_76650 [Rugosimonospora africana]
MVGGVGGVARQRRNDLTQWHRIRTTTIPAGMVEAATAAREAGYWRAAAMAARADVDVDLAAVRDTFGAQAAEGVEDDLRHLALDLLWWHLPRHTGGMTTLRARASAVLAPVRGAADAPLIRVCLPPSPTGPQRLSVSVSTAEELSDERWFVAPRYMWDVRESGALRTAWGGSADRPPLLRPDGRPVPHDALGGGTDRAAGTERVYRMLADGDHPGAWRACGIELEFDKPEALQRKAAPPTCPVGVADLAREVARAFDTERVSTLFGAHLNLTVGDTVTAEASDPSEYLEVTPRIPTAAAPVDLALIHAGLLDPTDLHPLMRAALFAAAPPAAGSPPTRPTATIRAARPGPFAPAQSQPGAPVRVRCRGDWHLVGVRDGALRLHDHDDEEQRREQVLRSLGGRSDGCFAVQQDWTTGATRLPRALAGQRREIVRRVQNGDTNWLLDGLDRGVIDPHLREAHGWTLLHMAMWVDHERVYPVLREHGIPVDVRDRIDATPLYVAVMHGGPAALVRRLLDDGADPFAETVHGASPHDVVYRTRREDLPFLLARRRP